MRSVDVATVAHAEDENEELVVLDFVECGSRPCALAIRQGDLKAETVVPDAKALAVSQEASNAVVLNPQSEAKISIGLPDAAALEEGVTHSGLTGYTSDSDQRSVLVNPTTAGVQIATIIGSADSPSTYTYPANGPAGSAVVLDDADGATVTGANGDTLAEVEAPCAQDANGKAKMSGWRQSSSSGSF